MSKLETVRAAREHLQWIKTNYFQWLWSFLKTDTSICEETPAQSIARIQKFVKLLWKNRKKALCIFLSPVWRLYNVIVFFPQLFVRALFDYDPNQDPSIPCKDASLTFKRGDVLQIVSMEDDTWWQACHLEDSNGGAGLIPSKELHERSFSCF